MKTDPRDLDVQALIKEHADYHAALTRILKWAAVNSKDYIEGNPDQIWGAELEALEQMLSDVGFKIDHSGPGLVIHGEKVELEAYHG